MQTTNSKSEPERKRRRGSEAEELAKKIRVSLYTAKQGIKYRRLQTEIAVANPEIVEQVLEIGQFIARGALRYKDAIPLLEALREVPELIPLVASGEYPLDKCLQELKEAKEEAEGELSLEEKVEQSFKRWLSKWPKDKRREIWSVIEDTFDVFYE